jgi:GTP-binding protein
MVVLLQLPRFHASVFLTKPTSLCKTHFNLLLKPKIPITIKSTLSTISDPTQNLAIPEEETHVQVSLEKLFVPPETDVPSGSSTSSLSARILKGSNIVLAKYARDAQISQADFVKSSVRTEDCPSDGLPEFALVGRSNVGKSSLLNSLVRRKRLALTSKKPGETVTYAGFTFFFFFFFGLNWFCRNLWLLICFMCHVDVVD